MKYTLIALLGIGILACEPQKNESETQEAEATEMVTNDGWAPYGDTIDIENVMTADEMMVMVDESGMATTKLEGTIEEACQKKGCWMKVKVDGMDDPIRVTFKDYGFFVPLNSAGNSVVMEGVVKLDTTGIDVLKHYAEDAGKSQEEIDAITEPEINLAFEATGVKIKEKI